MPNMGFSLRPADIPTSVIIVLGVLVGIFTVYIWFRIFRKMGYSGWWGLVMLVSPLNAIAAIYLAFAKWPIESVVESYARSVPDAAKEEAATRMLEEADRLRAESRFDEAKSVYQAIARLYPDTNAGRSADMAMTELRLDELQRP